MTKQEDKWERLVEEIKAIRKTLAAAKAKIARIEKDAKVKEVKQ